MNYKSTEREFFYKYKKEVFFLFILLLACFVRSYGFISLPGGLNQDEASIGYDAWALLHYGIDRNGMTLPAHLIAWGSGQNVLYAYFSMPFIALFGLTVFSVRIVNLLFGILSVVVVFFMVKRYKGYKTAIAAMSLMAIAPWHIMLSRWGLESNLFPAMLLLSVWFFLKAFDKEFYLIISSFLFALTLYAYGSAYLVVTLFCIAGLIYILWKKAVKKRIVLLSLCVFFIVALPIYLFIIINIFDLQTVKIGVLTIPHTYGSRISSLSGFSLKGSIENIYNNIVLQVDGSARNSLPLFGCFYIISLPFCIVGMVRSFKEKSVFDFALILWTIGSFALFFVYAQTNINRVNSIYIPLILYTAIGISHLIQNRGSAVSVALVYAIFFSGFGVEYFGKGYKSYVSEEFLYSFDRAVLKAEEIAGGDTVYVTNTAVNMPYIYVLFYTRTPPREYLDSVDIENLERQFQMVNSFGNYVFDVSSVYDNIPGIYILNNSQVQDAVSKRGAAFDEIYSFENYSVVVAK